MDNAKIDEAKEKLAYYLKRGFEAAGFEWTSDNDAEVSSITDLIAEGVKENIMDVLVEHEIRHMTEQDKNSFLAGTEFAVDWNFGNEVTEFESRLYETLVNEEESRKKQEHKPIFYGQDAQIRKELPKEFMATVDKYDRDNDFPAYER